MATSPSSPRLPTAWLAARLIAHPRWHPPVGNRACAMHPFLRAEDRCDRCGQPFCAACLQTIERWRICSACLAWLLQERRGLTWRERWQRQPEFRTGILATVAIAVVATVVIVLAGGVLGPSAASTAGATQRSACLERYPSRSRLYILGGTSLSEAVPATVELRNCGFRPGERFSAEARIDGAMNVRGVHNLLVGGAGGRASAEGEVRATIAIPSHAQFPYPGQFDLHLRVVGEQGSVATRDMHGGEGVLPVSGPCPPAPNPCQSGQGRPPTNPD
jgi:hypothetical protein